MTTSDPGYPLLSRRSHAARPAAPVRIVHLGLGNFFRAHQAWYTDRAPDAADWGIAAFTGRRPTVADALRPQDGLYTLITRGGDRDRFDVIGSVSAVHPAADHDAWLAYFGSPRLAVVTLTVTEAGYVRAADGSLDRTDEQLRRDVAALRADPTAPVGTVPARLLAGLAARARAGLGPIAVAPCDNLPGNGRVVARVVREAAGLVDPGLVEVVDDMVAFVTTTVDRITPEATESDQQRVRQATGYRDTAPVTTEPFSEWVMAGRFPAGRPMWEQAGATVVEDTEPFERRKLWLLNGAHSLLAYGGGIRGHDTVAEAVADGVCRRWLQQWWDEAARHLDLPTQAVSTYRDALLDRFGNPRIRHLLAQIAVDGTQKLPVRVLPVLRAERAAGRVSVGATRILGAWVCHLRGYGVPVTDVRAEQAVAAAREPLPEAVSAALALLDPDLPADTEVVQAVINHVEALTRDGG